VSIETYATSSSKEEKGRNDWEKKFISQIMEMTYELVKVPPLILI